MNIVKNNLNEQYKNLIDSILNDCSVFGKQIVHHMGHGFPIFENNRNEINKIFIELIWFLRGEINVDFLLKNDCDLWNEIIFENYQKIISEVPIIYGPNHKNLDKNEFLNRIKQDKQFANIWGNVGCYYGSLWRHYNKYDYIESNKYKISFVDQISDVLKELISKQDPRKMIIYSLDLNEFDKAIKIPSNISLQFIRTKLNQEERKKIFYDLNYSEDLLVDDEDELDLLFQKLEIPENGLSLIINERSTNAVSDLPVLFVRYGFLLNVISTANEMLPEFLIFNLGEVFINENQNNKAIDILSNGYLKFPKLKINSDNWDKTSINSYKSFDVNKFLDSLNCQDFEFNDNY